MLNVRWWVMGWKQRAVVADHERFPLYIIRAALCSRTDSNVLHLYVAGHRSRVGFGPRNGNAGGS